MAEGAGAGRGEGSLFVILMTLASAIGFAKGLVFAKVLGADAFGYYGLVILVLQFGIYLSNWGVLSALNNQLPIALGRADSGTSELVDQSLGALLFASAITTGVYSVVVGLTATGGTNKTALLLAAVITFTNVVSEFFLLLLRVTHRLIPLSAMYLLRAVLAISLGAVTGAVWGFEGVVVSELCALGFAILLSRRIWFRGIRIRRPSVDRFRWLLRWGAPLMAANTLIAATFTADRLFVASALPDEFAQYAFASLVVIGWLAVTAMLNQAIAPKLLYQYGAGLPLISLRRKAGSITLAAGAAGTAGLLLLLAVRGSLEAGVFSEYPSGLDAMPILYLGGMIGALAFPGFILHALRPAYSALAAGLGASVVAIGGTILVIGDPRLTDFAWLFVGSQTMTTLVMLAGAGLITRRS